MAVVLREPVKLGKWFDPLRVLWFHERFYAEKYNSVSCSERDFEKMVTKKEMIFFFKLYNLQEFFACLFKGTFIALM